MTLPPHMPEGQSFPSPTAQDSALLLQWATKLGQHEAKIASLESSRDKLGERMGRLEISLAKLEAGQAAASEMRAAQHAETMAQMVELRERFDRFGDLPAQVATFIERLSQITTRVASEDAANLARASRSFTFTLPEPTAKGVMALLTLGAAVVAGLAGWKLNWFGGP